MFEQSPLLGPGTGNVTTHTLEIVILLVVAFILGYLLRYFLDRDRGKQPVQDQAYKVQLESKVTAGFARFKTDDLKIVKGIGPEIEKLLLNAGICTWELLYNTSKIRLQDILNSGGERFRMHDPETWAEQVFLAMQGKWQELRELQEEIIDGHHLEQ